jgi:hypothetical protein
MPGCPDRSGRSRTVSIPGGKNGSKYQRETAQQAALLAVEVTNSMSMNAYKIRIAKTLIVQSMLINIEKSQKG